MPRKRTIFLVPGFFGFASFGDFSYWNHVQRELQWLWEKDRIPTTIVPVETTPTASLRARARRLQETIAAHDQGGPIHLVGHSTGGVDNRLLLAPGAKLGGPPLEDDILERVQTAVGVGAPHFGAPIASRFTSVLGQRLLGVLCLASVYVLRFGKLPISAALRLTGILTVGEARVPLRANLIDQIYADLLRDFTDERQADISAFLSEISDNQDLLPQLTPEAMDVFNTVVAEREHVRYASVVCRARPPGLRSTLASGVSPSRQAMHTLYQAMYRLSAGHRIGHHPVLDKAQTKVLRKAYGKVPGETANDGIVPTISQIHGEIIRAIEADHLDVIGHFGEPKNVSPHYDWMVTRTNFRRNNFEEVWAAVATYQRKAERR